ncbi:MAG: 4'-phosphopantetheinyl transferase superfamily protein [Acidobacteriaceae bacterium]|nr:4'-phosphopantetheinyl transferase superfamily protein [Acidobacteriaceae bacterium]
MDVYWIEQVLTDLPVGDDWLSANEVTRQQNMRFPKRRNDWRLGRWTAKLGVVSLFDLPREAHCLREIEIRSSPTGAPEVFINNQRAGVSISLSHRNGRAMCALAESSVTLGCDLEIIEAHSDAFIADYFTPQEQSVVCADDDPDLYSSLVWSAKESALKALGAGLRVDTRCVDVEFEHPPFSRGAWGWVRIRHSSGRKFEGWWQRSGDLIRTFASDSVLSAPFCLHSPHRREISYETDGRSAASAVS